MSEPQAENSQAPAFVVDDGRQQSLVDRAVEGIRAARDRVALMLAQQDADVLRRVDATHHMLAELVHTQVHPVLASGIQAALARYEHDAQRLTQELRNEEANLRSVYQRMVAVRTRLGVLRGDHAKAQRQWDKAKDEAADRSKRGGVLGRLRKPASDVLNASFVESILQLSREIAEVSVEESNLMQEKLRVDERILKIRADLLQHANQASVFVSEQMFASRHLQVALTDGGAAPAAEVEPSPAVKLVRGS